VSDGGGLLLHGRGRVSVKAETRVPTVTSFVDEMVWCGVDVDGQVEALLPGGCCPSGLTTDKDCTARVI